AGCVPWNWPRPQVFLGDSGAFALGMIAAHASLDAGMRNAAAPLWLAVALPLWVFVLDFVQVVAARLILGVPPWQGDRRHLTHIAQNLGLPNVAVAPVFVGVGLLGLALSRSWG
ncbi:MAG: hypothetical protein KDC87_08180, partial [Planctomycetes bacterium]|nr:hypothetical protein [Planctomycetota bacterium]